MCEMYVYVHVFVRVKNFTENLHYTLGRKKASLTTNHKPMYLHNTSEN